MVDVPRVPGSTSSSEQSGKDKAKIDAEKFKKLMEVDKTDPEQQKKRKRKEESEEEAKSKALASPAKERPPVEIRKGDSSLKINKAGAPVPKDRSPPPFQKLREPPKIEKVGEAEKRQKQSQKRPEEAPPVVNADGMAPPSPGKADATLQQTIEGITEKEQEASAALLAPMDDVIEEVLTPHETPFASMPEPPPATAKKEQASQTPIFSPPLPAAPIPLFLPSASEVPAPSSLLSAAMLEMFEKMVGILSVMTAGGISETTIHLDSAAFANSIFAGASIVIREFSTAPKAFNVEFQGNAQNTALFQANVTDLLAAFQNGNYNFKINRIDTSLGANDRPLFHRKEAPCEKEMGGVEGETR